MTKKLLKLLKMFSLFLSSFNHYESIPNLIKIYYKKDVLLHVYYLHEPVQLVMGFTLGSIK